MVILAALLAGCACHPDARLHQRPEDLSDLAESLLVGVHCSETLPHDRITDGGHPGRPPETP